MRNALIISLLILCLGSCVPGHNDYSEFKNLPPHGWLYADSVTFTPVHADSIATGVLTVALRHSVNYVYSNLYVEVAYVDEMSRHHTDTLNIRLADKYGRWLGRGVGTDFQVIDTVNPRLTHVSNSPVTVRHIMRVDTITGVELIGVNFTELN